MAAPTLIIGAGLAGLACARQLGGDCRVIERELTVGGMARTRERDGFFFDCTGHWLHLRDPQVEKEVRALVDLHSIERRSEIHLRGMRTPYPFQANTYGLPADIIADCVLGYFQAREAEIRGVTLPPRTFEDFILQKMGRGIARHFMIPYNTKLWTLPPSQMSHAWCQRFVPIPKPEEVVLGALMPGGASSLGYNATFLYPRHGGIGVLAEAMAREIDVRRGAMVVGIDLRARRVRLDDGTQLRFGVLVSTMPLTDLVGLIDTPPEAVMDAARRLRATSVTYWDVGVVGSNRPGDAHWVYFPESDIPFYRVGSASAAVSSLAPLGHRSYYVEVSHRHGRPCPVRDSHILAALRRVALLREDEEPLVFARTTIDCAYVLMDDDYGDARRTILEWLASQHILSIGRYGGWTYDSMEGAIIQGREAAARARELQ